MADTPPDTFTLGLVQMRCEADAGANLERALTGIRRAANNGAQIVCLPELFRTQYFCQRQSPEIFDLAEPVPGPTSQRIAQAAADAGVAVVASLFERRTSGVYHNTAAVFDADGSLLGLYRKTHIPDDPLYFEKYYFTPGDLGYRVFETRFGRVGVLVCWDQWFPEAARLTALQGAEVLLYPTAIGWHPREKEKYGEDQRDAWETAQRAHAIANGLYVAAVNRVGHEGEADAGLEFWGSSFVSDPFGVLLGRGSDDREEVLVVPCERRRLEDVRRNWPFFRDRRIDAYGGLTQRWGH
ncbi:MAG TPA: carbon-nitrogen hydrolase [Gemmataceae bacterium]|jgi:N-carbamoylputrescine amidase|nr:carbon-nitrogen hydrolase [Gemmataceae bacterium]